ncbi:hypothetical protein [Stenotrophomonas maltophilia]|uniref:hypothetical protein n=2 Tax=Stenotrophomonas maltophilia TaxID=40324 RepID=UPI001C99DBB2|nr:hypothetical protein [Stenotrophomonas maltophilia]MBY6282283.1 hypothetical protein [Stenotrophomonas maltophilia]
MAINRTSTLIHWNYFLALEEDLDRLARYVDLSGQNDGTFSIEIARLFLSASAEVDVVLKQIALKHNPTSKASSINAYYPDIVPHCPNFIGFSVLVPRYGLTLNPWTSWTANTPPFWWQDHNKVKHHRHNHFDKATLKNCLNSVAALFVSVIHLYSTEAAQGGLLSLPRILNVDDAHFGGTSIGRYGHSFRYNVT